MCLETPSHRPAPPDMFCLIAPQWWMWTHISSSICVTLSAVDGVWSQWTTWKPCKFPFGKREINCRQLGGLQTRERECLHRAHNGTICSGDSLTDRRVCYDVDKCYSKCFVSKVPSFSHHHRGQVSKTELRGGLEWWWRLWKFWKLVLKPFCIYYCVSKSGAAPHIRLLLCHIQVKTWTNVKQ